MTVNVEKQKTNELMNLARLTEIPTEFKKPIVKLTSAYNLL